MELQDDRTEGERATHLLMIGGTDSYLSGWGKAEGGASFAFWACTLADQCKVMRWVESRSDIKRVRVVTDPYRPKGRGHCRIYVVRPGHPSLA